jgi:hypothetical protein
MKNPKTIIYQTQVHYSSNQSDYFHHFSSFK